MVAPHEHFPSQKTYSAAWNRAFMAGWRSLLITLEFCKFIDVFNQHLANPLNRLNRIHFFFKLWRSLELGTYTLTKRCSPIKILRINARWAFNKAEAR